MSTHARSEAGETINVAPLPSAPRDMADATTSNADADTPDAQAVIEARFSFHAHDAPLSQVLDLMGMMTPLRFRYGAPPDAVVSIDVDDAPLLPALQDVLKGAGWQMRRANGDVFLFRAAPLSNATISGAPESDSPEASWFFWNGKNAPPARWMTLDEPRLKSTALAPPAPVTTSPVTTSVSVVDGVASSPLSSDVSLWRAARLEVENATRPGVQVFAPESKSSGAAWMRWRLPLRLVPRGARLLLDTPETATLYVNGAPVLSRWSGLRMIDLSRVLRRGDNALAIFWPRIAPDAATSQNTAASDANASSINATSANATSANATSANATSANATSANATSANATSAPLPDVSTSSGKGAIGVSDVGAPTPFEARPVLRYEWFFEDGAHGAAGNDED